MIVAENTIFYKAVGSEIEIFNQINQLQLPLLLKGPTGSGKSRFIEYMANEVNKTLVTVKLSRRNFSNRFNWTFHHQRSRNYLD